MGDIPFLAHRIPYPPDRGDKIRSFHLLKHLSAHARVHLVAFADDERDLTQEAALAPWTASRAIIRRTKSQAAAAVQALLSGKPVSLAAFDNSEFRTAAENVLAKHDIETIFVFSGQAAQYLPDGSNQRIVMDFVDVDSAKFSGYTEQARGPVRWMMRREAARLAAFERQIAARADASLFVSEAEALLFRERTGATRVHAIENGIDTAYFDPAADFSRIEADAPLIVFTGQMDYRPNIEAVTWFADAILPRISARHPEARFGVVGRQPTEAVRALARRQGVTITGEVADVRGWLAAASVVVAPLKLARGVQNKVLEAMAMARPVVASAEAAEGIDHGGTIRVGHDAEAIAAEVIALLDTPTTGDVVGNAARARVEARYCWAARLAPLDALMGFAAASAQPHRTAA